jgi:hypothetical protein
MIPWREVAVTALGAPSAYEVFALRCEVRAMLVAAGEFTLAEAVDGLQSDAETCGLVALLGQDTVQAIMAGAFGAVRKKPDLIPDEMPDDCDDSSVPRSTLDAAEYLVRISEPKRFETWLLKYSAAERAAIVAHIESGRS